MVLFDLPCSLFLLQRFSDSLGGDTVFIAGLGDFHEIVVDK